MAVVVDGLPELMLAVLFFVMMFGIGFVLAMLMRMTWAPAGLYLLVILPVVVYSYWNRSTMTLGEHLLAVRFGDGMIGLAGLAGAVLSGWTIRKLRLAGYRLF